MTTKNGLAQIRPNTTQLGSPIPLSDVEQLLIRGIDARAREIQEKVIGPFNRDAAAINRLLEREHGLTEGSIEMTHRVNSATMQIETILSLPVNGALQELTDRGGPGAGEEAP